LRRTGVVSVSLVFTVNSMILFYRHFGNKSRSFIAAKTKLSHSALYLSSFLILTIYLWKMHLNFTLLSCLSLVSNLKTWSRSHAEILCSFLLSVTRIRQRKF